MALVSFFNDPFVSDMERAMNRMFHTLNGVPPATSSSHRPSSPSADLATRAFTASSALSMPMDIIETSSAYELHADAPGMSPDDVKIELHEGVLTLSGSRKIARDDKAPDGKVWRSERASYSFSRAFTLPDSANAEGISATMDKGVLKVTVPKREPQPKPEPKRITVTGA